MKVRDGELGQGGGVVVEGVKGHGTGPYSRGALKTQ